MNNLIRSKKRADIARLRPRVRLAYDVADGGDRVCADPRPPVNRTPWELQLSALRESFCVFAPGRRTLSS